MKGKKLLAGVLSASMVLGTMALPVFADDEKGTESNPYTFDEFNNLTDISGREVWVDVDTLDISSTSTTLGNYNMSDELAWGVYGGTAPAGKYTKMVREEPQYNRTVWGTEKAAATVHITGNIKSESGNNDDLFVHFKSLYLQVPAASTVILESMTLNGIFNLNGNYIYHYNNPDGTQADGSTPGRKNEEWGTNAWYNDPILTNKIVLNKCTVNGQWYANGNIAENISIINTTFNHHINDAYVNNSNPIWWKNQGKMNDFVMQGSTVETSRPIKFEGYTGNLQITDNTFKMLDGNACGTTGNSNSNKNAALYIDATNIGNVEITNNKVDTAEGVHTQLLAYKNITVKDGSTFTISDNKKADNTSLSLTEVINRWKADDNAAWTDDIVQFVNNDNVNTQSKWDTATDSGFYMNGDTPLGMMRFLFRAYPSGTVQKVGIRYIKTAGQELTTDKAVTAATSKSAVQGDIIEIPAGNSNKYYAAAFIETTDGTVTWSEPIECSVDWNKKFNEYNPGGAN